jgi:hypothetical protein
MLNRPSAGLVGATDRQAVRESGMAPAPVDGGGASAPLTDGRILSRIGARVVFHCHDDAGVSSRLSLAVSIGALALSLLVAGCDPAPRYGPQAPPYIGVTYAEDSVVATGLPQSLTLFFDQDFAQHQVMLSVPEGAYPSGTTVTIRAGVVDQLAVPNGDRVVLDSFLGRHGGHQGAPLAVQVLPAIPAPAKPLTLGLLGYQYDATSYDVLYANECDAAWQVVGAGQAVAVDDRKRSFSIAIAEPGLWTLGQAGSGAIPLPAMPLADAACPALLDGGGR